MCAASSSMLVSSLAKYKESSISSTNWVVETCPYILLHNATLRGREESHRIFDNSGPIQERLS